ncbi:MAG TPA: hypothetical protein IAA30_07230 [Candidatus Treponema faecavium]|nr:hypothetical protein [Candidatus Treponema faecavium]
MNRCIKNALTVCVIALGLAHTVFAADAQAGSVNYFAACKDNAEYAALLKHVFDDRGVPGAFSGYTVLTERIAAYPYELWQKDLMRARGALIVARYANSKEQRDAAETYMRMADALIEDAGTHGAPVSACGVIEALSSSFWYLINKSVSKGIAFGRIVNDLWENYPEDFHVLLLTADKYLHSPGIVGGNKKKGLALYQRAEEIAEQHGCAVWDWFSIYAGLAAGYDKAGNDVRAYEYALRAREIYTADEQVNEIITNYED